MLLSDPDTARLIREEFVPMWRMVRPVPKVSIDFGNGKKLERTLAGNTILFAARPDGTVFDAFPGVWTPDAFQQTIRGSLLLGKHGLIGDPGAGTPEEAASMNGSKMAVEAPILRGAPMNASKAMVQAPLLDGKGRAWHGGDSKNGRPLARWEVLAKSLVDISKTPRRSDEVRAEMGGATDGMAIVRADARINRRFVRPVILEFLGAQPRPMRFDEVSGTIFRRILHLDLDDPYLGLADFAIPGTPPPK